MEIYRAALDGELRECFSGREGFLYDLLRYHLGWVDQQGQPESGVSQGGLGESFHALAAPAVGEALTGEFEAALPVAAGVELLHNFYAGARGRAGRAGGSRGEAEHLVGVGARRRPSTRGTGFTPWPG